MGEFDTVRTNGIALIKKKGRAIEIHVNGDAAPADPSKPWNVTTAAPTIVSCRAVVVDFSLKGKSNNGEAEKTILVPGDCGLKRLDTTMRIKVLHVTGGATQDAIYAIEAIDVYEPDGLIIGWKLRCSTWPQTLRQQQTLFSAP